MQASRSHYRNIFKEYQWDGYSRIFGYPEIFTICLGIIFYSARFFIFFFVSPENCFTINRMWDWWLKHNSMNWFIDYKLIISWKKHARRSIQLMVKIRVYVWTCRFGEKIKTMFFLLWTKHLFNFEFFKKCFGNIFVIQWWMNSSFLISLAGT